MNYMNPIDADVKEISFLDNYIEVCCLRYLLIYENKVEMSDIIVLISPSELPHS